MSPDEVGQLIVREGRDVVQVLPLTTPVTTIGRAPDNHLTLSDPEVSRHHAEVRLQADGPMLTDLDSANGTFLDDARLLAQRPRLLADGATFRIGPYTITYQAAPRLAVSDQLTVPLAEAPPEVPSAAPAPEARSRLPAPAAPPRATWPTPPTDAPASSYLRDLPVIFQESAFLGRFLLIFESIWEPLEQRQNHVPMYFDPLTCPAAFVPWLASWLELSLNAHWPESRRRRLLAEALELYRWRGTAYGLARIIEVCTGLTPEIAEVPSQPFVFSVRIAIPPGADVDQDLIEDLIAAHKPAHAAYRLELSR